MNILDNSIFFINFDLDTLNKTQLFMITFDSNEELVFSWYLNELKDRNIVDNWIYQPNSFILSYPFERTVKKVLKTSEKYVKKAFLRGHTYKADFAITWNKEFKDKIFFTLHGNNEGKNIYFVANTSKIDENIHYTLVDVKGTYNQQDAWRRFSIEQKWIFTMYGLYVQKVIPDELFKKTFTPARYCFTNKTMKPRKLKWRAVTVDEYIKKLSLT